MDFLRLRGWKLIFNKLFFLVQQRDEKDRFITHLFDYGFTTPLQRAYKIA